MILVKNLFIFFCLVFFFNSCNDNENTASNKKLDISITGDYQINSTLSKVNWEANTALGIVHKGTILVSSGYVKITKGQLKGGKLIFDLNSLKANEINLEKSRGTEVFLKSKDMFNVKTYPKAILKIISLDSSIVKADLTILDKTKTIFFPAEFSINDSDLKVNANIVINRTDWGIFYASGSYTDWTKDKIIEDEISFVINVVAEK